MALVAFLGACVLSNLEVLFVDVHGSVTERGGTELENSQVCLCRHIHSGLFTAICWHRCRGLSFPLCNELGRVHVLREEVKHSLVSEVTAQSEPAFLAFTCPFRGFILRSLE